MALFSVSSRGPLEALLRLAGLMLVVGLVVLAFWKNSERNMERLNARAGLDDQVRGLSDAERERVQAFVTTLSKTYGMEARIVLAEALPSPPEADAKTLFLGLSTRDKTAVLRLPPLAARALGPDFTHRLEQEHFPFHFQEGRRWQQGLLLALDLIETRLAALSREPEQNATGAQ